MRTCQVVDLGMAGYEDVWTLQKRLVAARVKDPELPDVLLLLEHPSVFTLGKRGGREFIQVCSDTLEKRQIPVIQTNRGGLVTWHGPGQLVAYPVWNLKARRLGVRDLVERLESVMVETARRFGVDAEGSPVARGLWVRGEGAESEPGAPVFGLARKLGSIGIAIHRNVSCHGIALNVGCDMTCFSWIQPCGLSISMTSIEKETGTAPDMREVKTAFADGMEAAFGGRFAVASREEIEQGLAQKEDA